MRVSKSFLFVAKFIDWRAQGFMFHCPANGHPDCFQFGKIINKDYMNMLHNTSCEHMLSLHLDEYLGEKLLSCGLGVCLRVRTQSLPEKAMAAHSTTLVWRIPGTGELVGCSPWGHEELDTTERLHLHFSLSCIREGNGNPLQCSCLENPRDGRAWWAAIYEIAQRWTQLK